MKKIFILILLTIFFTKAAHTKSPPLGTGALAPANIMLMLDNSGSMAWDLDGNQLTSDSSFYLPYDVNTDSSGNIYVMDISSMNAGGRIHVYGSDGKFKKRFLKQEHATWNRPATCEGTSGSQYKFDIYKDEIYVLEFDGMTHYLKVLNLDGECVRQHRLSHSPSIGNSRQRINAIAVTENYIYLGTGAYGRGCVGQEYGQINIYTRTNLRFIKKLFHSTPHNQSNVWCDIGDMAANSDGTKLLVTSNSSNSVCLHSLTGENISGCTKVGNRPNSRPNWNYDRSWSRSWSCGTWPSAQNGWFYNPWGADFDSSDNIYVTDGPCHRIQKFNSSGSYLSKFGSVNYSGGAFYHPRGIHVSSTGKIYVADTGNHVVRELSDSSNTLSVSSTIVSKPITRMEIARKVIKRMMSDSQLTSSANFGLMEWGHPHRSVSGYREGKYDGWRYNYYGTRIRVPISDDGARKIITDIDNVKAGGGTYLKQALDKSRNYFSSGVTINNVFYKTPRIPNADCQGNYLIVISDGVWAQHGSVKSAVLNLKNQMDIKTFAMGFAVSGLTSSQKQNYADVASLGGTVSPLYADNENEMIAKLKDAIMQVTSGTLTFNAPVPISEKQKGNFVYQSTFKYSKNTQWEGHLKKYKFNSSTGKIGDLDQNFGDAAVKLNSKKYTDRNIWTIGIGTSSLNNFTTTNRGILKTLLYPKSSPTNNEVDDLINFVRGIDTYDEDGDGNKAESRHKLADIYHANINVVGPVEKSFSQNDGSSNNDKKNSYYRYQKGYKNFKEGNSCGNRCNSRTEVVIAGANSGILHAFRTSNGEEIWGYIPPNLIGKLSEMVSSKANATNPIYGIDGSATVEDIYFDDTPDDGSDNPRWRTILLSTLGAGGHGFFALDITDVNSPKHLFAVQNDPLDEVVRIWNQATQKTTHSYTPGTPMKEETFDYQKLGETWSAPRIFRIKHNGADKWVAAIGAGFNGGSNPNFGSAVYIIDLEEQGQILKKIDIDDKANNNIVNSVPSDLVIITADETERANYNGAMIYVPDLEGKITKINLTDQGTMYEKTTFFDSESTNANGRYLFKTSDATIINNTLWLYFGTGNMQKLQTQSSNIKNRLYGIKDKDFPDFKQVSPTGSVAQCKTGKNNCPTNNDLGWYIDLDKSKKVTAAPTVDKNLVYFPVYEPLAAANICDVGNALLYSTKTICGEATFRKLGKGVASEVQVVDNNLVIGISGEAEKGLDSKDNLISIRSEADKSTNRIIIDGWKQID